MRLSNRTLLAAALLAPLSAFAEGNLPANAGIELANKVDIAVPMYWMTEQQPIAKGGRVFIQDADIPQYGKMVGGDGGLYLLQLPCILNGDQMPTFISVWYKLHVGIQRVEGACTGNQPWGAEFTFLPKWDHQQFGIVELTNYTPR